MAIDECQSCLSVLYTVRETPFLYIKTEINKMRMSWWKWCLDSAHKVGLTVAMR